MSRIDTSSWTEPTGPGDAADPRASILFAEDDAAFRQVCSLVLVRAGYQVDSVPDGESAWRALRSRSYDLLITDNRMPRLSGLELIQKVRVAQMALPCILASGTLDALRSEELPWLDGRAMLSKPFTAEQLIAAVGDVLRMPAGARPAVDEGLAVWEEVEGTTDRWRGWGIND